VKPLAVPRNESIPASIVPFLTVLLLMLVSLMPLRIPGYASVTPAFALMGVFHWTVYRPALLPPLVLFLLGAVFDLVTGAPLGLTPLVWLLTRGMVLRNRQFFVGRQFAFVWFGFTLAALGAASVVWLIGSALSGVFLDLRGAPLQWVLTVSCYPAVSWCLARLQRVVLP
jgi:rod shape-determining protein MreD